MNTISYEKVGVFTGVAMIVSSLSQGKPIKMNKIAEHQFNVSNRLVKVPLHWFYPKQLKNAQRGKRPVFVKMHFYSCYLKSVLENGKPEKEVLVKIKVSQKKRDGKITDIILDVFPERHGAEVKFTLDFSRTNKRAISVPNALEKIRFIPLAL